MTLHVLNPTFSHGVHPAGHKDTADLAIERFPFPERCILPLSQHIGAASTPVVRVGEPVQRGQLIAKASGFVSTCLHSPLSGRVVAIAPRRHAKGMLVKSIEIEADPFSTQQLVGQGLDPFDLSREDFVGHVQRAGLVGLGGAAFPSHVKYALDENKPIRWLVINGSECEPYLSVDHRMMVERPEAIVRGIQILAHQLQVRGTKVGIELNKPEAVAALREAAADEPSIEVVPLSVKYPQGAEKMLIKAIFDQEVPAGKLPLDLGMVVNNVSTMAALADYFDLGMPLIERVVTVAGPGIGAPANLLVPIGTSVSEVLRHCEISGDAHELVMGGPMMGMPLSSSDVPVMKGTSGLLAFTDATRVSRPEYACIRCGRCLEACANMLNPARLARLAKARRYEDMEAYFVNDCMECGACTYACPSGIPIVQLIRVAKNALAEKKPVS